MAMLNLVVCGCSVSVSSRDPETLAMLDACYGAMRAEPATDMAQLRYVIERDPRGSRRLERTDGRFVECADAYELLYLFEKDLTLELQGLRPELYFLHAGVVERDGKAVLFAAPSGTGKSTLCYALLHQGFRYLSDELAPVDLQTMQVLPYPHALCMKSAPPAPYLLPVTRIDTGRTLHLPPAQLPAQTITAPVALAAVLIIQRGTHAGEPPAPRRLSPAETATRLYVNTLNALAHPGDGLDAALTITRKVPGWEVDTTTLTGIGTTLNGLLATAA